MASMHDGTVGVSYEVYAPDEEQAVANAQRLARLADDRPGDPLIVDQVGAGQWEVVLRYRGPVDAQRKAARPVVREMLRAVRRAGGIDDHAVAIVDAVVSPQQPVGSVIRDFMYWLVANTDTFDPVQLDIGIHEGVDIKPDDEMIESWIALYVAGA